MDKWLKNVRRTATLCGIQNFQICGTTKEVLAYAYWANFSAIEAVIFLRLVVNELENGDTDYDRGILYEHVSRFVTNAKLSAASVL